MTVDRCRAPAAWREAALEPPRALGAPPARGRVRESPADFVVEEELGFAPDGGAAHLLLRVEKTDANTLAVARALARHAGARPADVGFAGLKDRHAVATQWFSVPAGRAAPSWPGLQGNGFRVLESHAHSRKLKRGALSGNRFRIRVALSPGAGDPGERLAAVRSRGVPNYFGPQRFGADGSNLDHVVEWLACGRLPAARDTRAFTISAARSLAFNAVLGARVRAGNWDRLVRGDVLNLDGRGSLFPDDGSADLTDRVAGGSLHPTGPLPGRGGMTPAGEAAAVEGPALASLAGLVEALAAANVEAARRPLRVLPREFEWRIREEALELSFLLPRGAFATALLREVIAQE